MKDANECFNNTTNKILPSLRLNVSLLKFVKSKPIESLFTLPQLMINAPFSYRMSL